MTIFLSLDKLGKNNYRKGLTDSNKEEIPFPKENTMSIVMTKTMLDNESVAVMKPSKYIIRHFLGPNRSPWTISCILRLYQNHRATQTMPPKLDQYSRVSH